MNTQTGESGLKKALITGRVWFRPENAAAYLDMSVKTFRNYASKGVIRPRQNPITGTKRYHIDDLDAFFGA